jgi:hypothetical protein
MDLAATNLASRRDVPVVCPCCGRSVRRKARQQVYCSTRCRKRAHHAETAVQPTKIVPRYPPSGNGTNPQKKMNGANGLQGSKARSRTPQTLLREVIETEVFGGRSWRPVTSTDGVTCWVSTLRPRALRDNGVK